MLRTADFFGEVLFLSFSVPLRKVRIVLEDPRSSFTAEMGFRFANDKVTGLSQRRHPEDVGAAVTKGSPGILEQFKCPETSQPCC